LTVDVRDGRAGVDEAFVELPHALYADDPWWIPEDRSSVRRAFSSGNPWFARGEAVTMCVAGEARMALFANAGCEIDGQRSAFFGCWEQRAGSAAGAAMFVEALRWARERGCTMLHGPIDFTTFGRYRVSSGIEPGGLPFPGEPYQAAHQIAALETAGFGVTQRYVTQIGPTPYAAAELKRPALAAAVAAGYDFAPLDAEGWMRFVPELYAAADTIFGGGHAYTPVSREYFETGYGAGVARRLCPHTSVIARAPDGSFAGFLLAYPHHGPLAAQRAGTARVDAAALSFAEHAGVLQSRGERTAIVKTAGVMPGHRRRGVLDAMSVLAIDRGRPHYDRWMAALVRDGNPSGRFGAPHAAGVREYALYARHVTEGPSDD
jgi:hypothetical protein